jgi:hypothetical protein
MRFFGLLQPRRRVTALMAATGPDRTKAARFQLKAEHLFVKQPTAS